MRACGPGVVEEEEQEEEDPQAFERDEIEEA